MRVLRYIGSLAALLSLWDTASGLPLENEQALTITPSVESLSLYIFEALLLARREGANNTANTLPPVCDRICTYHLIFQATYTTVA